MSEKRTKRSKILTMDRSIVPVEDAQRAAADGMNIGLDAPVTQREMINGCANAAMAVGAKMYDQFSEETGEYLRQMELDIIGRADARMDAILAKMTGTAPAEGEPGLHVAVDVAALAIAGPCIVFVRARGALSAAHEENVSRYCHHMTEHMQRRDNDVTFLYMQHAFDILSVGDAQLAKLGLARIPLEASEAL